MSETKDVVLKPGAPKELLQTLHASYIHGWEADKGGYEYVMSEYLRMSGQSVRRRHRRHSCRRRRRRRRLLSSSRFSARTCDRPCSQGDTRSQLLWKWDRVGAC